MCVHFIHAFWKETALWPRCVHWCVCMCMCVSGRESLFQNTLLSCPGWVSRSVSCITMRRFTAEEKPTQNTNTQTLTLSLVLPVSLPLSPFLIHKTTHISLCIFLLPKGECSLLQLLSTCFYNFQYLLPTPLMSYSSISCKADSELHIYSNLSPHTALENLDPETGNLHRFALRLVDREKQIQKVSIIPPPKKINKKINILI